MAPSKNPDEEQAGIDRLLGRLGAQIDAIRDDMAEVKALSAANDARASDHRRSIYQRIEEQGSQLGEVSFAVKSQAQIHAQTREVLKELADIQRTMATNVQPLLELRADLPPMVEGWKDLRKTGTRLIWVIGLAGGGLITFMLWFGDVVRQAILHWLGISPS